MNIYQLKSVFLNQFVALLPVILWRMFLILLLLVSSVIVIRVGRLVITKLIEKQKRFLSPGDGKRLDTLTTILNSVLRYGVYFIAAVAILGYGFGMFQVKDVLNVKTVLAAAGIGGIALGFGAQSLVKDVISGFFILVENQFAVGDVVTIGILAGTVEEMELRVTKIRNYNGELYTIPNGEIKTVTNHTKGNRTAIVDIKVPYDVNVDSAVEAAGKACKMLEQESTVLAEPPQVLGVTEFGDMFYIVRAVAKTVGAEHWAVERELRKKIILCFEQEQLKLGGVMPKADRA